MWLRYHPDGTALVHRSLAVGCHSTLSRPALPTHEYHGFNSSKRYGSCLFMCLSVISYFGVISRVGGKGKKTALMLYGQSITRDLRGTELSCTYRELWVELLIWNQSKFIDQTQSIVSVLMSIGQGSPSENTFPLNIGFLSLFFSSPLLRVAGLHGVFEGHQYAFYWGTADGHCYWEVAPTQAHRSAGLANHWCQTSPVSNSPENEAV